MNASVAGVRKTVPHGSGKHSLTSLQPSAAALLHNLKQHGDIFRKPLADGNHRVWLENHEPQKETLPAKGHGLKIQAPKKETLPAKAFGLRNQQPKKEALPLKGRGQAGPQSAPSRQQPAAKANASCSGAKAATSRKRADKESFKAYATESLERHGKLSLRPEDLEVLQKHLACLKGGADLKTKEAVQKLGYTGPYARYRLVYEAVCKKLDQMRNMRAHGVDPLKDGPRPRAARGSSDMRTWLAAAFKQLPNCTGTLEAAGRVLQRHPEIGPKLDKRPDPRCAHTPMWQSNLHRKVASWPEFVKTGRKKDRWNVLRYDETRR